MNLSFVTNFYISNMPRINFYNLQKTMKQTHNSFNVLNKVIFDIYDIYFYKIYQKIFFLLN